MPNILCIETATEVCSVAISREDKVLTELSLNDGNRHSKSLISLIRDCSKKSHIPLSDLDAIAISDGPGSYTGLRVGASTAKGLCYGLSIPLIPISTLRALTSGFAKNQIIMSTIDARRMEAYTAIFKNGKPIKEVQATIWSKEKATELSLQYDKLTICGNGIAKASHLFEQYSNITLAPRHCKGSDLVKYALEAFSEEKFADIAYHTPFYFKNPNITTPKSIL